MTMLRFGRDRMYWYHATSLAAAQAIASTGALKPHPTDEPDDEDLPICGIYVTDTPRAAAYFGNILLRFAQRPAAQAATSEWILVDPVPAHEIEWAWVDNDEHNGRPASHYGDVLTPWCNLAREPPMQGQLARHIKAARGVTWD